MVSDTPESVSALEGKRLKEGRAPEPASPANQGADLYKQYAKDARSGGRALAPSDNPELSPAGAGDGSKYKSTHVIGSARAQPMSTPPKRDLQVCPSALPALRRLCSARWSKTGRLCNARSRRGREPSTNWARWRPSARKPLRAVLQPKKR